MKLNRWRRGDGFDIWNDRVWSKFGTYSALVCTSGLLGALHAVFNTLAKKSIIESRASSVAEKAMNEWRAAYWSNNAGLVAMRSLQFVSYITSLNMLLFRVSRHASHRYYTQARDAVSRSSRSFDPRDCIGEYPLYYCIRRLAKFVVLLSALLVIPSMVVAGLSANNSLIHEQVVAALDGDGQSNNSTKALRQEAVDNIRKLGFANSVYFVLASFVLMTMSVAYVIFVPICIVMFYRIELRLDGVVGEMEHRPDYAHVLLPFEFSPQSGESDHATCNQVEMQCGKAKQFLQTLRDAAADQRRRFMSALAVGLTAFLYKTAVSVCWTYAQFNVGIELKESCERCGPCQALNSLFLAWMLFSFEAPNLVVESLFETTTLVFSLWLMMSKEDRRQLKSPHAPEGGGDPSSGAMLLNERQRMGIDFE